MKPQQCSGNIDEHSECDTYGWHIEKIKSGDDLLKCTECGSLLIIDSIDHSAPSPVQYMLCIGCGNEYRVTKSPSAVE